MEKYVLKPSLQFYVTYEVTGDQKEELTNDFKEDEHGNSYKVIQNIDGLVLTTEMITKYKLQNGTEIKEESKLEITVLKGQKLVYVEGKGYVIPERPICKIDEAISDLSVLKGAIE